MKVLFSNIVLRRFNRSQASHLDIPIINISHKYSYYCFSTLPKLPSYIHQITLKLTSFNTLTELKEILYKTQQFTSNSTKIAHSFSNKSSIPTFSSNTYSFSNSDSSSFENITSLPSQNENSHTLEIYIYPLSPNKEKYDEPGGGEEAADFLYLIKPQIAFFELCNERMISLHSSYLRNLTLKNSEDNSIILSKLPWFITLIIFYIRGQFFGGSLFSEFNPVLRSAYSTNTPVFTIDRPSHITFNRLYSRFIYAHPNIFKGYLRYIKLALLETITNSFHKVNFKDDSLNKINTFPSNILNNIAYFDQEKKSQYSNLNFLRTEIKNNDNFLEILKSFCPDGFNVLVEERSEFMAKNILQFIIREIDISTQISLKQNSVFDNKIESENFFSDSNFKNNDFLSSKLNNFSTNYSRKQIYSLDSNSKTQSNRMTNSITSYLQDSSTPLRFLVVVGALQPESLKKSIQSIIQDFNKGKINLSTNNLLNFSSFQKILIILRFFFFPLFFIYLFLLCSWKFCKWLKNTWTRGDIP